MPFHGATVLDAVSADTSDKYFDVSADGAAAFQITGIWTGTVTFEGTIDGTNWVSVLGRNSATGAPVTSTTANGIFVFNTAVYERIRPNLNWTSGTSVTVLARGSDAAADLGVAQLTGSNAPSVVTVTESNLTAGSTKTSTAIDLTASPMVKAVSYQIVTDQPITCKFQSYDGTDWKEISNVTVPPDDSASDIYTIIPPFRPIGQQWRCIFSNPTATDTTVLRIYELHYTEYVMQPQNMRAVLAHSLAITDTATHSAGADPHYVWPLRRIVFGGGKVPIYVDNQLDQQATVDVRLGMTFLLSAVASLGTIDVPASSQKVITNSDFPGLDVPSEEINITIACASAPSSGTIGVYVDTVVGGSA